MSKVFYKAKLIYAEEGIQVLFKEICQIHETPSYSYCIDSRVYPVRVPLKKDGETDLQTSKRLGYKIYRIHKECSRIAFETKEKAFKQLMFLKRRQIMHMQRELALLTYFTERVGDSDLSIMKEEPIQYNHGSVHTLPDSSEKLCEFYVFD